VAVAVCPESMTAIQTTEQSNRRPAPVLSRRQQDCLAFAASGLSSSQIGRRLGVSPRTVDEHLMLACRALGVRTRVQAVARMTAGLRRPPESARFLP